MKTIHSISRYVLVLILMMMGIQQLQAQDAFYIYRNDGDFNGFFFDQVKHMGFSKIDFDGVEHDVYVVQEIETEDSLYRIPIAAIDSIGFQQPEIRMNSRFNDLRDLGKNFIMGTMGTEKVIRVYEPDSPDPVQMSTLAEVDDIICFETKESHEYEYKTGYVTPGTITAPYVCKVKKITGNVIYYDPITSIEEVFDQLISVEQIGYDSQGNVRSRIAGADKIRRVGGSRDLTLVDINTKIGIGMEPKPGLKFSISADAEYKSQAEVVYNIGLSKGIYAKVSIADELSANFSGTADYEIDNNDNLWEAEVAGGMPVGFPSFLPLLEIRPIPGMFLRAEGHATATIISPKLGFSNKRTITIDSKQPWSSVVSFSMNPQGTLPSDEDNSWKFILSLNGFVQMGMKIPVRIFTCSWAKELLEMSVGADLYVGPKLSANFSFDAVAAAGGSMYDALADTKIDLSALAIDAETSATFKGPDPVNWGETYEEKFKLFETGVTYGTISLNLLPTFEDVEMHDNGECSVFPRGNYLPCQIGAAVFDSKDRFVSWTSSISNAAQQWENTYSFCNTIDEVRSGLCYGLPFGKYKVYPAVYMFNQFMIAKSQGKDAIYENDGVHTYSPYDWGTTDFSSQNGFSGYLYIMGLDDLSEVAISSVGDEEEGSFFAYALEDEIEPLNDVILIYDVNRLSSYDIEVLTNIFPKNDFYVRKERWRKLKWWMTGERDDKSKSGYINIHVTRDGITKDDGFSILYSPDPK